MNISRDAFYRLVKMQNLLNDLRFEKLELSDALQHTLEASLEALTISIQHLTSSYLKDVDHNREISANNAGSNESPNYWWP